MSKTQDSLLSRTTHPRPTESRSPLLNVLLSKGLLLLDGHAACMESEVGGDQSRYEDGEDANRLLGLG